MSTHVKPWETNWAFARDLEGGGQGLVSIFSGKQDHTKLAVLKTIVSRWRNDSQAHERMRQEIDTLRKLGAASARVPEIYDSYLEHPDSEPFVLMSYIKGSRLDEWLSSNAPTSASIGCKLTQRVAETVVHCHQLQIGHRDLKPANIILMDDNVDTPYVIDFGISFDSKQTAILTKAGEIFRNEFITLPECQDLRGGHRDLRSDITALAGLFFMCLTGEAPITLRDAEEASPHKRHESLLRKATENPELTERLNWFFDRAFAYRISERFQSLEEFIPQLKLFEEEGRPETLTLQNELGLFDKILQAKDRTVQVATLRRRYEKIRHQILIGVHTRLIPNHSSENKVQDMGLSLGGMKHFTPTLSGADLLENEVVSTFTVSRNHFHTSAVAMFVAFGVGMQIHIYTASYSSPVQNITAPHESVKWAKTAVIDEDVDSVSPHTVSLVANDIEGRLAREVRKLTRKLSGT